MSGVSTLGKDGAQGSGAGIGDDDMVDIAWALPESWSAPSMAPMHPTRVSFNFLLAAIGLGALGAYPCRYSSTPEASMSVAG